MLFSMIESGNNLKKSQTRERLIGNNTQAHANQPRNRMSNQEKVKQLVQEEMLEEMYSRYRKYFLNWRDYEMLTTILAMIGLILAVIEVSCLSPQYGPPVLADYKMFYSKSQKASSTMKGR